MRFRIFRYCGLLLATVLFASGCAGDNGSAAEVDTSANPTPPIEAEATTSGMRVQATIGSLGDSGLSGSVTFVQTDAGLKVAYVLDGLPQGEHGFHVHENGSCADGEDGAPGGGAGGHFNPGGTPHGAPNLPAAERHVGDLGNIQWLSDGTATGSFTDTIASLEGPDSIVGKALVIHANLDDLASQPSGDAGARVGCGVIAPAELP